MGIIGRNKRNISGENLAAVGRTVYSPVLQVGDAEQGLKSLWVSGTIPTLRTMPVGERWSHKQLLEVLSTPEYGIVRTNACNVFMTPKRDVVPPSIQ